MNTKNIQPNNLTGKRYNLQFGFTLMEVIVATSIFAVVITLMLTLFNLTLRIQRKTEALRQVAQTVRNVSEFLVKEIRNGQIDYNIQDGQVVVSPVGSCPTATLSGSNAGQTYQLATPDRVGIINIDGDRECIVYDSVNQKITLTKENVGTEDLTPPNVRISFARFIVHPVKDPYTDLPNAGSSLVGIQPMVTILLAAQVTLPTGETKSISYQTSVSTNVYDIPNKN